jgi:hypothetical protein
MLEEDIEPQSTLGGRRIDTSHANIGLIHEWIAACEARHDEFCLPIATKELDEI